MQTRCFGYAVPQLSLVPFADNANHHTTDAEYEMFNYQIGTKMLNDMKGLTEVERCYATKTRQQIDFFHHLSEEKRQNAGLDPLP